jgi:hypothetical protein
MILILLTSYHITCLCLVREYRDVLVDGFDEIEEKLAGFNSCLDANNQITVGDFSTENLRLDYLVGLNLASFITFSVPILLLNLSLLPKLFNFISRQKFLGTFKKDMNEQFELFMKYG